MIKKNKQVVVAKYHAVVRPKGYINMFRSKKQRQAEMLKELAIIGDVL